MQQFLERFERVQPAPRPFSPEKLGKGDAFDCAAIASATRLLPRMAGRQTRSDMNSLPTMGDHPTRKDNAGAVPACSAQGRPRRDWKVLTPGPAVLASNDASICHRWRRRTNG